MLLQTLLLGIAAAAPFADAKISVKPLPGVPKPLPVPEVDICTLPAETGKCRAAIPRFAFDPKLGECKKFIFGGCGGNANNFETLKECEAACPPPAPPVVPKICKQPPKTGFCRAAFRRFFFDHKLGECKMFTFGGCGGNDNNFKTLKECKAACSPPAPPPPDICKLPKETGPCKARFVRFAFNPKANKCERFVFGGCDGNKNNFETLKQCVKACPGKPPATPPKKDICKLRLKKGLGRAKLIRWGFSRGRCIQFVFGGGRRNANNFKTKAACEKACPRRI